MTLVQRAAQQTGWPLGAALHVGRQVKLAGRLVMQAGGLLAVPKHEQELTNLPRLTPQASRSIAAALHAEQVVALKRASASQVAQELAAAPGSQRGTAPAPLQYVALQVGCPTIATLHVCQLPQARHHLLTQAGRTLVLPLQTGGAATLADPR